MTDAPTATPAVAPNRGVKQGLPTLGLRQAEESATKLWEVARGSETSKQLFAEQTGHSTITSGAFRGRLAVLRGLGVINVTGEKVKLTQLGLDLVQDYDEEKRHAARVSAIHSLKAYRELVEAFADSTLPAKAALTSRLKYEYGKSDELAGQAADAFIDSLNFAGMLDSLGIVHLKGVASKEVATESSATSDAPGEQEDVVAELEDVFGGPDAEEVAPEVAAESAQTVPIIPAASAQGVGGGVSLDVTLDLSDFEADEVIRILQALGLAKRD